MLRRKGRKTRRSLLVEKGSIGRCNSCRKLADDFGFACSCKWVECVSCWFKRTGGHDNEKSPEWHCQKCLAVSIYDQDMIFIKRWTREQWERWNKIGEVIQNDQRREDN